MRAGAALLPVHTCMKDVATLSNKRLVSPISWTFKCQPKCRSNMLVKDPIFLLCLC